ncbi:hypothetical protein K438DRAFT_1967043 [Mycena galopus ATCC 62051]|nr:hypothetical protein K438DRAFT_1967043 [Mycena galopus ATCC 62051]
MEIWVDLEIAGRAAVQSGTIETPKWIIGVPQHDAARGSTDINRIIRSSLHGESNSLYVAIPPCVKGNSAFSHNFFLLSSIDILKTFLGYSTNLQERECSGHGHVQVMYKFRAKELRARFEELASEIELQKQLLKKLEHDKHLAQSQLNAVVDPIARLPVEISSEIFLQSLAPLPKAGAREAPMLLLNIYSNWTAIALSEKAFWAAIQIDFPGAEGLTHLLPIWFQRAQNRPICISLCGDFRGWNHSVSAVVWQHAGQLKNLEISNDMYNDDKDYDYDPEVDLFDGTTPSESLPSLQTVDDSKSD